MGRGIRRKQATVMRSVARSPFRGRGNRVAAVALAAAASGGLVAAFVAAQLAGGGRIAAPLDDTYIHLQYARSLTSGCPFCYHPGEPPTSGATSPAYALLLAPMAGLFPGTDLPVVAAIVLGALALAAVCLGMGGLAARLAGDPRVGWAGGIVPLSWGWAGWHAASGMETIPATAVATGLAWGLLRWGAVPAAARSPRSAWGLVAVALAAPWFRPALGALSLAAALVLAALPARGVGRFRLLGVVAGVAPLVPGFFWRSLTGRPLPNGAVAKWLPANPWLTDDARLDAVRGNIEALLAFLAGWAPVDSVALSLGVVAFPALAGAVVLSVRAALRRGRRRDLVAPLVVGALVAGLFSQTTFATFQGHRMRYAVPFVLPLLGMGVGAFARLVGLGLRGRPGTRGLPPWSPVAAAALALVPAPSIATAVGDHVRASGEIRALHHPMAEAVSALPEDARIGVTDAGALAWYGDHPTVDLVGLTSDWLAADQYIAGPGAQLEAVERIPAARRPTHMVTFSRPTWWFPKGLLGRRLAGYRLPGPSTIAGGSVLALWEMDLATLDDQPRPPGLGDGFAVVDALDVADLGSERAHGYALVDPGDPRGACVIRRARDADGRRLAEGGRIVRVAERFRVRGSPDAPLVLVRRADGDGDRGLVVAVNGVRAEEQQDPPLARGVSEPARWTYGAWAAPAHAVRSSNLVEVTRRMGPVGSFHWWAVAPSAPEPR